MGTNILLNTNLQLYYQLYKRENWLYTFYHSFLILKGQNQITLTLKCYSPVVVFVSIYHFMNLSSEYNYFVIKKNTSFRGKRRFPRKAETITWGSLWCNYCCFSLVNWQLSLTSHEKLVWYLMVNTIKGIATLIKLTCKPNLNLLRSWFQCHDNIIGLKRQCGDPLNDYKWG